MFCSKCGAQIPEGNKFCGRCGAQVIATTRNTGTGSGRYSQKSSIPSGEDNFDNTGDDGTTVLVNNADHGRQDRNQGYYGNSDYDRGNYGSRDYNERENYGSRGPDRGNYGGQDYYDRGNYGNQDYYRGQENYSGHNYYSDRGSYAGQDYNYDRDNYSAPGTGKKSGKGKRRILIGAGAVIALALAVFLAVRFLIPLTGSKSTYVYLRDGNYEFTRNLEDGETTELDSCESENNRNKSVRFSEDGKYLYFFTEFDDATETGTLNRIACGRLSDDRKKNDKNTEEIDTDIKPDYSILDNGNVIYLNADDTLYYYDGKNENRISNDVSAFYTDGTDRVIYVSEEDLYGCDLKDGKRKSEKLESDYEYIVELEDYSLDHFYYVKNEEDDNAVLYSAGIGEEVSKVDEYVTILYTGDGLLYSAPNGDTVSLYDLVTDDLDEAEGSDENAPDKTELVEDLKDEDNAAPLSNLYFCNGKEIETVQKDIFSAKYIGNAAIFNTEDTLGDLPKLSEISSIEEVKMICALDLSKQNYIASQSDRKPRQLSEDAADELNTTVTGGDFTLRMTGDSLYLNNSDHKLRYASVDDETVGKFKDVADKASIINSSDTDHVYCIMEQHKENDVTYADLYECDGKNTDLIAENVIPRKTAFYEEMILVYTNSANGSYELSTADDNGETEVIAGNVTQHICIGPSKLLYISDHELYLYDGKKSESLEDDVSLVWASDEKEPDKTFGNKK